MTVPVITFFNDSGGVGTTTLVYHVAWMLADEGHSVLAADLDPQANLTAAFLDEDSLDALWNGAGVRSVYSAVRPLVEGTGDVSAPEPVALSDRLKMLPGDLALSGIEDELTEAWPRCLEGKERSFRVVSGFARVLQAAAAAAVAEVILVDVGPNLGAINRAALVAADYVVVPLAPDLFSLRGLENLGPALRAWRAGWQKRLGEAPKVLHGDLPVGSMKPVGYVVQQQAVRLDRPTPAYEKWIRRIPSTYRQAVLEADAAGPDSFNQDPNCLAVIKNYRSLVPMAQEARKPLFHLKAADGAIGGHQTAVQDALRCYRELAQRVGERTFLRS